MNATIIVPDPVDEHWKRFTSMGLNPDKWRNLFQHRIDNPSDDFERRNAAIWQRNIDAIDRYTIPLFTQSANEKTDN